MSKIPDALRDKLIRAGIGGGAVVIAMTMGAWFEGDGPSVRQADGTVMYRPYRDTGGIWTVCRGITGPSVVPGKLYTRGECDVLEREHYAVALASARRLFPVFDTYNRWIQAALIDWLYNLGENPATVDSTLRAKFNRGDIDGGCRELTKWVKGRVRGELVTLNGLVARRDAAKEICLDWSDVP